MQSPTLQQKLEAFFCENQAELNGLANYNVENKSDTPDIVQQAYLIFTRKVYEGRWSPDFDSPEPLKLVRGIVFNLCCGLQRTTRNRRRLDIAHADDEGKVVACDDSSRLVDGTPVNARWQESPEFEMQLREALDKVRSELNERETGLFEVCFIHKLKPAEIALLFDLSHNAYKSARRRLVAKLTDILARMNIEVHSYLAWLGRRKAKRREVAMRRAEKKQTNSISEDQQV